jgi:APA family basic amino acid/polyamine antiporter
MVMARDGLLPAWFADVSKRFGTPANASLFSGAVTGVLGVVLDINLLAQLVSIGTLSIFCGVNLGLIVSRVTPKRADWSQRLPALKRAGALLTSCFAFAIDYRARNATVSWFGALSLIAVIASAASFKTIPMVNVPSPTRFAMPGVPYLPALGVLLTSILIAGLGALAIVRYVVYTSVCFVAYIVFATARFTRAGTDADVDADVGADARARPRRSASPLARVEMPRLDADRPVGLADFARA